MRFKERLFILVGLLILIILFTPYMVDVVTNRVDNIYKYFNPVEAAVFYLNNPQVLVLIFLFLILFFMLLSVNNNQRLTLEEDTSREATQNEIHKEFASLNFSKEPIKYSAKKKDGVYE